MKLKFKEITMGIDEIKITSAFSRSMPRISKLKTCMDFYRANGYFDRQIIIDSDKYLHDGYCVYLTAKLLDVQTVRVLMVSGPVKAGTIWEVTNVDTERVYLTDTYVCWRGNYLVLDSYTDGKKKRPI